VLYGVLDRKGYLEEFTDYQQIRRFKARAQTVQDVVRFEDDEEGDLGGYLLEGRHIRMKFLDSNFFPFP